MALLVAHKGIVQTGDLESRISALEEGEDRGKR
jgi:hypothetical protein